VIILSLAFTYYINTYHKWTSTSLIKISGSVVELITRLTLQLVEEGLNNLEFGYKISKI